MLDEYGSSGSPQVFAGITLDWRSRCALLTFPHVAFTNAKKGGEWGAGSWTPGFSDTTSVGSGRVLHYQQVEADVQPPFVVFPDTAERGTFTNIQTGMKVFTPLDRGGCRGTERAGVPSYLAWEGWKSRLPLKFCWHVQNGVIVLFLFFFCFFPWGVLLE